MTLRERIGTTAARILDGWSGGAVKRIFIEAATVYDDDAKSDALYRRLSGGRRDLKPIEFKRGQELAFYLWQRNPLAKRMIQILVDFCTGDDYSVRIKIKKRNAEGEVEDTGRNDAQAIWDDFARDPVNNLEEDTPEFVQDLLINGEIVFPTTVNPIDGSVRLGYVDPGNISSVKMNPRNIRQPDLIVCVAPDSTEEISMKVARIDIVPKSETFNKMIGDVIYYRINHVVNQTRGHSHLLELCDWLDALDQFLFDSLDGFRLRNSFFYDLELQGLTADQIEAEAKKITVPSNGSIRVHNEKAKYDVQTPDLKAVEVERALVTFQTFVVGSKGFPAMWFGSGAETNKATAGEMSIPTMKMIRAVQRHIRSLVKLLARYITDQAQIAGKFSLAEGEYIDVEVTMFDPEKKDTDQIGAGMVQLVQALVLAVSEGWAEPDTAKKIIDGLVTRMGVEVDSDKKVQDIKAEKDEADADDAARSAYAGRSPKDAFSGPPVPGKGNGTPEEEGEPAEPAESAPIKILQTFQPAPLTVHVERKAKLSEAKFEVKRDSTGRITELTRKAKED